MMIMDPIDVFDVSEEYLNPDKGRSVVNMVGDSELVKKGYIAKLCDMFKSLAIFRGDTMTGSSNKSRKRHMVNLATQLENGKTLTNTQNGYSPLLFFNDDDLMGLAEPHEDAVVIAVSISGTEVRRVLIDTGSSADVMFKSTYDKIPDAFRLAKSKRVVLGFTENIADVVGEFDEDVELGRGPLLKKVKVMFMVVNADTI